MKYLFTQIFIIALLNLSISQDELILDELHTMGTSYYNSGDYENAIILYEDLLAAQEFFPRNDDMKIANQH